MISEHFTVLRDLLLQTQMRRESRRTRGGCAPSLSLFYDDVETIALCARCKLETSHPIKLMAGSAQKALTPGSSILNWILYKMDLFCGLFLNIRVLFPARVASPVLNVDCHE